jgi:hypothetical protein
MRLIFLLFTAMLAGGPAYAGQVSASSKPDQSSSPPDRPEVRLKPDTTTAGDASLQPDAGGRVSLQPQAAGSVRLQADPSEQTRTDPDAGLPVSLDKIRDALQQPPVQTLRGLNEIPNFKVEVHERQKISLEDLIRSLDFKSGPVPAGGLYGFEQQRQMFNPTDHPLQQPYAAFGQGELLTVLIENLVGKYLAGKAVNAVTAAERAHAETAAREEVRRAIADYCAAQPNNGAGIQIYTESPDNR